MEPENFLNRFEIEKTLGARFFGKSREVVSKLVDEPFATFRSHLDLVFADPDGAFASILMSHLDDGMLAAEVLSKPTMRGAVKPVGLFGWLTRRRRKILAPATEMLPEVRTSWRGLKRSDEGRLRCRYEDHCCEWLSPTGCLRSRSDGRRTYRRWDRGRRVEARLILGGC